MLVDRANYDGWYQVSNIYTGERGYMHRSTVTVYLSRNEKECITQASVPKYVVPLVPPCAGPLLQENDEAYDTAIVTSSTATFVPQDGSPGQLVYKHKRFFLVNRNKIADTHYRVLDLETGDMGTIECTAVQPYYSLKRKESTSPFVESCSGYSTEPPQTTLFNNTDRTLYLYVDGVKLTFPANATRNINISAGEHNYLATAAGVLPLSASDTWKLGCNYKWTFFIKSR